jgi:diguanylate cyclase (GGDEF)-like protein/PAS domain S-box-containing protein
MRRRSSDSATASLLTIAAHVAATILLLVLVAIVSETQVSWLLGAMTILIATAAHTSVARFVRGRTFARLILPIRLHETLNTIPDGLMLVDDQDRIVIANHSLLSLLGMRQRDVVGRTASSLPWLCSSPESRQQMPWSNVFRKDSTREDKPGHDPPVQSEQLIYYRVPDGTTRFFSINSSPMKTDQDGCQGALVTVRDVTQTESRRAEVQQMLLSLRSSRDHISSRNRELKVLAEQDSLTGCLNRRALFDKLQQMLEQAAQNQKPLACLMIDVDHFKQVNDLFGHQVGDKVLQQVAQVLQQNAAPDSIISRYGGEEFCVLIPKLSLPDAAKVAGDVRKHVSETTFDHQPGLRLSVSIGVQVSGKSAYTAEALIGQADECLYLAKKMGRDRVIDRDQFLTADRRQQDDQAERLEPTSVRYADQAGNNAANSAKTKTTGKI